MASKYLDDFLAKASPETKAALEQSRQELKGQGVQLGNEAQQQQDKGNVAERSDVRQIGQDLQRNGVELKENTNGPQTPARIGESRPYADPPKYMNEQQQSTPSMNQETRQGLERDGQQNVPQKRASALDRAKASPTSEKTPALEKSKEKDLER